MKRGNDRLGQQYVESGDQEEEVEARSGVVASAEPVMLLVGRAACQHLVARINQQQDGVV